MPSSLQAAAAAPVVKPATPDAGAKMREAALERIKGQSAKAQTPVFENKDAAKVEVISGALESTEKTAPIVEFEATAAHEAATPDAHEAATPDAHEAATPDSNEAATPDTNEAAIQDASKVVTTDAEIEEKAMEEKILLESEAKAKAEATEKAKLQAEEDIKIEAEKKEREAIASVEEKEQRKINTIAANLESDKTNVEAEQKEKSSESNVQKDMPVVVDAPTPPVTLSNAPKRVVIPKVDLLRYVF